MFNIHQKLFLSKVFLGIAIIAFAIFLSLYISLQIQYNLAVEILREQQNEKLHTTAQRDILSAFKHRRAGHLRCVNAAGRPTHLRVLALLRNHR